MLSVTKEANNQHCNKKNRFNQSNWYVFYTSPRAEKKVLRDLTNQGFDAFLPVRRELRYWKNRQKKWIDRVLFPGYIFVNTFEHKLHMLTRLRNIASYIHIAQKPCIVPHNDIECIRKMIDNDMDISVDNNFGEGDRVKIVQGPLSGYEGVLTEKKGKGRFGIKLTEINQTVFIDICTSMVDMKENKL